MVLLNNISCSVVSKSHNALISYFPLAELCELIWSTEAFDQWNHFEVRINPKHRVSNEWKLWNSSKFEYVSKPYNNL